MDDRIKVEVKLGLKHLRFLAFRNDYDKLHIVTATYTDVVTGYEETLCNLSIDKKEVYDFGNIELHDVVIVPFIVSDLKLCSNCFKGLQTIKTHKIA